MRGGEEEEEEEEEEVEEDEESGGMAANKTRTPHRDVGKNWYLGLPKFPRTGSCLEKTGACTIMYVPIFGGTNRSTSDCSALISPDLF